MTGQTSSSIDPDEIAKFDRMAADWWSPSGSMKPLHKLNPARIGYLRGEIAAHFGLPDEGEGGLAGLRIIDVGCGGGLVCEPLARIGATMTGLDAAPATIAAASRHAEKMGLTIDYRSMQLEDLAASGEQFDVVLCLEVIEHVNDPAQFVRLCAGLARPGGLMIISTINRTLRAYALAIVAAERVLRWLPAGTHEWSKFVTPEEVETALAATGLKRRDLSGLVYNPLADSWRVSRDTAINYFASYAVPGDAVGV